MRIADPVHWGGYGDFRIPSTGVRTGRLYVGEAAGFQDLLFGFGIRLAMQSGILAAQSVLSGSDYNRLWKSRLLKLLVSSRINRSVYTALRGLAAQALWLALRRSERPDLLMRKPYTWWPAGAGFRSPVAAEATHRTG